MAIWDKNKGWGLLIQAVIAVLTALSGVLTGCNMAG